MYLQNRRINVHCREKIECEQYNSRLLSVYDDSISASHNNVFYIILKDKEWSNIDSGKKIEEARSKGQTETTIEDNGAEIIIHMKDVVWYPEYY